MAFIGAIWVPPGGSVSSNNTVPTADVASHDGNINFSVMFLALGVSFYIVASLFTFVWIMTRDFNEANGPPWVPSFFRTETFCVCFEPIVRFWPAILWPIFLLVLFIWFGLDKGSNATTLCGREKRRSKMLRRLQSTEEDIYDTECASESAERMNSQSSRATLIPPPPLPPAVYGRVSSDPDLSPISPLSQSRANSWGSLDSGSLKTRTIRSSIGWVGIPARGENYNTPPPLYQLRQDSRSAMSPFGSPKAGFYGSLLSQSPISSLSSGSSSPSAPSTSPPRSNSAPIAGSPIPLHVRRISIQVDPDAASPLDRNATLKYESSVPAVVEQSEDND